MSRSTSAFTSSAYKVSRYPKELVDYMRGNARHLILFGSNHPFWPAGECIAGLDALDLGEHAKAAFLAGTAWLSHEPAAHEL